MKYSNSQLQKSASDLSNYLGCKHLSKLDLLVAEGKRKAPSWQDPAAVILAQRGQEHEQAYVTIILALVPNSSKALFEWQPEKR